MQIDEQIDEQIDIQIDVQIYREMEIYTGQIDRLFDRKLYDIIMIDMDRYMGILIDGSRDNVDEQIKIDIWIDKQIDRDNFEGKLARVCNKGCE